MSNVQIETTTPGVRELVAANLTAELRRKRFSDRQAATALGLTNVYVSRRASGAVELSASDLALFSDFLDIPISKLFEGMKKGPAGGAARPSLPDLDSNQEPAGSTPAPESHGNVTRIRPHTPLLAPAGKNADVLAFRARAPKAVGL